MKEVTAIVSHSCQSQALINLFSFHISDHGIWHIVGT